MTQKRGRPRKHPDRKKYLAEYMREYRQKQKEQMNSLRKTHPGIYETFFGKSTRIQKKKTRKTKK